MLDMSLPDNMVSRGAIDKHKLKRFTVALDSLGGEANHDVLFARGILNLDDEVIEAAEKLAGCEDLDFRSSARLLSDGFEGESRKYQSTMRVMSDNGWLRTRTDNGEMLFVLTEKAYDELEWL
jgi:hypothetical protein